MKAFEGFVGNENAVQQLKDLVSSNRKIPESKPMHVLISGSSGTGKTELAKRFAQALEFPYVELSPDCDIAQKLLELEPVGYTETGQVTPEAVKYLLHVDEAHLMKNPDDLLIPLERFEVVTIMNEVSWIPYFVLVLTTDRPSVIPQALRYRCFPIPLIRYTVSELAEIVEKHYPNRLSPEEREDIAKRSKQNARTALRFAQYALEVGSTAQAFKNMGIEPDGVDTLDRMILDSLAMKTVSKKSLSVMTGLSTIELEERVAQLIGMGHATITTRGVSATKPGRGRRI